MANIGVGIGHTRGHPGKYYHRLGRNGSGADRFRAACKQTLITFLPYPNPVIKDSEAEDYFKRQRLGRCPVCWRSRNLP